MPLVYDKPESEYHSDTTTLSSSGARELLYSPLRFKTSLSTPKAPTAAMNLGSLTHALILNQPHNFAPHSPANLKAGKEEVAKIKADGKTPIPQKDWDTAYVMAEAAHMNTEFVDALSSGQAEVSAYGTCPITDVQMRGRFDLLNGNTIWDVKTAAGLPPSRDTRLQFQLQSSWYVTLAELNGIKDPVFKFLVIEKGDEPLVSIHTVSAMALALGNERGLRARNLYQECVAFDSWPAYATTPTIDLEIEE